MAAPEAASKRDVQEAERKAESVKEECESLREVVEQLKSENEDLRESVEEFRRVFAVIDETLYSFSENTGAWSSPPEYSRENAINDAADDDTLRVIKEKLGE